jgi:GNAT superfamily N-acetyltransferase
MGTSIRKANLGEEVYLSDLAIRSKSVWGYSEEFLEACRPHLKIDKEYLSKWPVFIMEEDNQIKGFYSLKIINHEPRLDNLWIEPPHLKHGIGKQLFKHATETAKALGWASFRLAGEPGAVVFYEKMGAKIIGTVQSRLKNDLFLPHMEMNLDEKIELG